MVPRDTLQDEVLTKSQKWLQSRYGLLGLGLLSFIESALPLPLVTDPFLVVYILANRSKALLAVLVSTVTSVLGGVAAYGFAVWSSQFLLGLFSPATLVQFMSLAHRVSGETFIITILGGLTPVPYTLVALAAGFVQGNISAFIAASLISRLLRYGLVGYVTYRFGTQVTRMIKRNSIALMLVGLAILVLYFCIKFYFNVL